MKHTPNGNPRNHADEIANARARNMARDMVAIKLIDRPEYRKAMRPASARDYCKGTQNAVRLPTNRIPRKVDPMEPQIGDLWVLANTTEKDRYRLFIRAAITCAVVLGLIAGFNWMVGV